MKYIMNNILISISNYFDLYYGLLVIAIFAISTSGVALKRLIYLKCNNLKLDCI